MHAIYFEDDESIKADTQELQEVQQSLSSTTLSKDLNDICHEGLVNSDTCKEDQSEEVS